ncbi:MAG: hypothetical protein PHU08_08020, partial [Dehalococcoidales bacterium]|nr:hypothetical protein [Dehalococcoidales bacterium]
MGGGDVSSFAPFWRQALGNPPVPVAPSLEMAVPLPSPTALLEQIDGQLANTLTVAGQEENVSLPSRVKTSITLVAVAPYGRNIGRYLAQIIDEVRPDIITIDIGPMELSAGMLYAFSLPG